MASPPSSSGESAAAAYFRRFWDAQLEVMGERLSGLRELPAVSPVTGEDMSVARSGGSRSGDDLMVTRLFESDEYRYVRMTMLEGKHAQVFTSVWYPRSPHLPVLACDLLRFGPRAGGLEDGASASSGQQPTNDAARHVCIVDYQPVVVAGGEGSEEGGSAQEEERLQHLGEIDGRVGPVRRLHPGLHGEVSRRFYPEGCPYFSSQMLLGRWQPKLHQHNSAASASPSSPASSEAEEDPTQLYGSAREMVADVYEGWRAYVDRHVTWSQQQQQRQQDSGLSAPEEEARRLLRHRRHAAYDRFSSRHDPAVAMLARLYGPEWADSYVHGILFPLSRTCGGGPGP
jgi:hypothetical protein